MYSGSSPFLSYLLVALLLPAATLTLTPATGVTMTQENDPNSLRQPRRISTSRGVQIWDRGLYVFDGSGNMIS